MVALEDQNSSSQDRGEGRVDDCRVGWAGADRGRKGGLGGLKVQDFDCAM